MLDKLNYGCYNADREWSTLQFVTVSDMTDAYLLIRSRWSLLLVQFFSYASCAEKGFPFAEKGFFFGYSVGAVGKAAGRTWVWNPDTNSSGITLSLAKLGHQEHSHHSNHLTFSSYPTDSVCVCLCEYTRACLHVCECIYIYIYNMCVCTQVSFNYETYTLCFAL